MEELACFSYTATLQRHNTENLKQIFPEKELCGHSPNFHIYVSVSEVYVPSIGLPILLAGKYVDRSCEYTNRSQTHECGNWAQFLFWEYRNGIFFTV
jgi:hypothetical protein